MSAEAAEFEGVVVAAGSSTRFGASLPKQFHELGGKTLLERSVELLARRPAVWGVTVVLADSEVGGPRGDLARSWPGVSRVVAGGPTRAASVAAGLAPGSSRFILIHDAARPLAPPELVDRVIDATRRYGAAAPLLEIADTVKQVADGSWITGTLDRSGLGLAQTPQGFRRDWLSEALEAARSAGQELTDEAAAIERVGRRVAAVCGDPANRKITTSADLSEANERLGGASHALRVGTGYDVHRLGADRPLVLGGVRFEGQPGLVGHSDADVVLHAAMDALLGAAGLGDLGAHFPPEDPAFAGADSTGLARKVAEMLRRERFEIVNLDLTLLAEAPKIREHARSMRETIAESLGIDPRRVALKATTLEGLGALGRREGIGCQAIALIRGGAAST